MHIDVPSVGGWPFHCLSFGSGFIKGPPGYPLYPAGVLLFPGRSNVLILNLKLSNLKLIRRDAASIPAAVRALIHRRVHHADLCFKMGLSNGCVGNVSIGYLMNVASCPELQIITHLRKLIESFPPGADDGSINHVIVNADAFLP